jgi:hypothetical protein
MKTKQTILCDLLAVLFALTFTACPEEDDPGEGGPTTWTAVSDNTFDIRAIAYGNNRFVAVGESGKMAYSADGITWTAVSDSTFGSSYIYGITYEGGRFVAGGADGKMAYSADGITWTAVPDSTFGTTWISAIAYGNNRFVAVGESGKMAYCNW